MPVLVLIFLTAATMPGESQQRAVDLSTKIKTLDSTQLLTPTKVSEILGISLRCKEQRCEAKDFRVANTPVSHLDFRFNNKSFVLILQIDKKICVSSATMENQFGPERLSLGCTDSVSCSYVSFQGRWQHVTFPAPNTPQDPACVRSITINSDR